MRSSLLFEEYGLYFLCRQLRMETWSFPCCPIALLTCKKHTPFCPTWEGKIPRFDPFKGIDGANEILFFIVLKIQNGNELQCFFEQV